MNKENTDINRRLFLRGMGLLTATLAVSPPTWALAKKKEMGLQLWTVNAALNHDFDGTLEKIAKIGYTFLETAVYDKGQRTFYGRKPADFRKKIESLGMRLLSGHSVFNPSEAAAVFEDAASAGMSYMLCSSIPENLRKTADDYRKLADQYNIIGETSVKHGIKFGYHNHSFEFEDKEGQMPYEILLAGTNPKTVTFEMDIAWLIAAKKDPAYFFNKYPGRFQLLHVKDLDLATGNVKPIGQGDIDFNSIFKMKHKAGVKHYFVELNSADPNVFENIKTSFQYLMEAKKA
jgi:sugar phosphate isomerase/epimerase